MAVSIAIVLMARMQIPHLRHGLVAQASVGPCLMPRRSRENVFAVASLVCLHSKRGVQFNPGHVFARDSALDFPFAPASLLPRSLQESQAKDHLKQRAEPQKCTMISP